MLPCLVHLTPQVLDPISDIRGAFTAPQLLPSTHVGSGGVLNQ